MTEQLNPKSSTVAAWVKSRLFSTSAALKDAISALEIPFTVRTSSATHLVLHCIKGPIRESKKVNEQEKRRNKQTEKEGCPWRLNANFQKENAGWVITSFNGLHSHDEVLPKLSLDPELKTTITNLSAYQLEPAVIRKVLKSQNQAEVSVKQICVLQQAKV